MWAESPNGPRTQGLGPGPKGRSQGPGPFFKITLLFGANCSVLDFCCIVGCKTSGFDGLVALKIYSYGHVDRKPQWSRTQGLGPGPKGGSQDLFFVITLLLGVNCSVLDFCCIVGCKTSKFDGLISV